ncbi:MAG: carboxylating nicotinate-nucleotide diphosphorylase [Planctomycetota bacterium]|nr:MAG: carboxylating nicotinate-nucleotide diphosphorylase [Planctomycetota bacterium]
MRQLIELSVEEDLGEEGDVTSRVVPPGARCRAEVVYREGGVAAGLPLAERVLKRIEPEARFERLVADGQRLPAGGVAARIEGPARGVLAAERLLLNFLQRLSGVATATRRFVDAIGELPAQLLDTRKTTPGWRALEKYAVRAGGGANHRMGLYDQVLIKDNHLVVHGGESAVAEVVALARREAPADTPVEVEVTTLQGALAAARAGADIVLLDNFSPDRLRETVDRVRADARERGVDPPRLEASGGIEQDTVRRVAEAGVDRISTGWVTHSAPALDIALEFRELE